ncbi:MAG: Gfo/Idh/MocA family oxidoreductase [Pirellulaceae bacterium]|nr:Gfo/Idh/MocA family oxidoreductase [Pirellulaceae bacterium]
MGCQQTKKWKMGLVGGGEGSFIGRVHYLAATLDGRADLVAGALSSDPVRAKKSADRYFLTSEQAYDSWQEMFKEEARKPDDEKIDFVSVATPNHTHFDIAKEALEAGFHVVCDKPMTFDFAQADELAGLVLKKDRLFALLYTYTGYPLVRQAREMVLAGELGEINAIRTQYIQGWLRTNLEKEGHKQASWRTDPTKSGAAGCFGDIATHAFQLGRYVTGLAPVEISCQLRSFVEGRKLDDYGAAFLKYENGALGTVTASQISHGRENDLLLEVDGTLGSLLWRQENPNELIIRKNGQPHQIYTRDPNGGFLGHGAATSCRLPGGHPEGFLEAFANIYTAFYDDLLLFESGNQREIRQTVYPNVFDGAEGMLFIERAVASSQDNGAWKKVNTPLQRERQTEAMSENSNPYFSKKQ